MSLNCERLQRGPYNFESISTKSDVQRKSMPFKFNFVALRRRGLWPPRGRRKLVLGAQHWR